MADTVIATLDAAALDHPDRPALEAKREGSWRVWSWREYRDEARTVARGLMALRLEPGRGVAVLAGNRPEWFFASLGGIAAGAVPTGLYTTAPPEQWRYVVDHCGAVVAFVEGPELLARFLPLRRELPALRAIVLMSGSSAEEGVLAWDELKRRGEAVAEGDLAARIAAQKADDLCTLIYTSGTTGPPKGVALSHRNVTWTARAVVEGVGLRADDVLVCYLPLSHIAEQVVSLHSPMVTGACVFFAESLERLGENLREVRPCLFLGVPRVWEKMQAAIQAAGASGGVLKRRLAAWARRLGLEAGYAHQQGRPRPLLYPLAERLVFSTVRRRLGFDRARICAVSTAPTSRETLEFFLSLGIPIMEVYGMSECTGPTTLSLPGRYRTAAAGFAIAGTELRTAPDGEVLIRGPHVFLGYHRDEAATREAVDEEGWLHSGDVGRIDAEGFLWITDRKKDLIITSGGKNVAPQVIEAKLKGITGVAHAVVVGDRRKYLVALLTLDPERTAALAAAAGSEALDAAAVAAAPACRSYVEREIERINESLARYETIKRFTLLPGSFSVDGGELTPTLKIKRRAVEQKYAREIESLYA